MTEEFLQRKANFTYNPSFAISPVSPTSVDIISGKLQGKSPLTSLASATNVQQHWLPNALLAT